MTGRCESCQEALVQFAGRGDELAADVAGHLAGCAACQAVAVQELGLADLLERALPAADPDLVTTVVNRLPRRSVRWQALRLLPVAASLFIALLGAVLLGGVPGGSLLAALPSASAHSVMTLSRALGDWAVATGAIVSTVGAGLSQAVVCGALVVAGVGLVLVAGMVRRWRRAVARW